MFTPYKDCFLKLYVKGPLWGRSISMGYTEYAVARSIAMIVFLFSSKNVNIFSSSSACRSTNRCIAVVSKRNIKSLLFNTGQYV